MAGLSFLFMSGREVELLKTIEAKGALKPVVGRILALASEGAQTEAIGRQAICLWVTWSADRKWLTGPEGYYVWQYALQHLTQRALLSVLIAFHNDATTDETLYAALFPDPALLVSMTHNDDHCIVCLLTQLPWLRRGVAARDSHLTELFAAAMQHDSVVLASYVWRMATPRLESFLHTLTGREAGYMDRVWAYVFEPTRIGYFLPTLVFVAATNSKIVEYVASQRTIVETCTRLLHDLEIAVVHRYKVQRHRGVDGLVRAYLDHVKMTKLTSSLPLSIADTRFDTDLNQLVGADSPGPSQFADLGAGPFWKHWVEFDIHSLRYFRILEQYRYDSVMIPPTYRKMYEEVRAIVYANIEREIDDAIASWMDDLPAGRGNEFHRDEFTSAFPELL